VREEVELLEHHADVGPQPGELAALRATTSARLVLRPSRSANNRGSTTPA